MEPVTKLRVLDLFSGIGGFSLGLERTGGFETVAFCEIEEFPRRVLGKNFPSVPIHSDVRKLKAEDVGPVDVICGGYPCQPFSTAGKRLGQKDDRHLWPEFNRLVAELRPAWVIGENVAGHISMGLDDVLSDLEGQGYAARTFVIPACALGAHHRRDRCWTIAHAGSEQHEGGCNEKRRAPSAQLSLADASDVLQPRELDARGNCGASSRSARADEGKGQAPHGQRLRSESSSSAQVLAHAESERRGEAGQSVSGRSDGTAGASAASEHVADAERFGRNQVATPILGREAGKGTASSFEHSSFPRGWQGWLSEPNVGRVANGIPSRVDRLKCLGNAVVPQIPEMIGYAILEAEGMRPVTTKQRPQTTAQDRE